MDNEINFDTLSPLFTFKVGGYLARWGDLKSVLDEYDFSYSFENIARVMIMSIEIKLDNSNSMHKP